MDAILGIFIFLFVLAAEITSVKQDLPIAQRLRLKSLPLISKSMVAFLSGLMMFVLFTDRIPLVCRRVTLIVVCLLLIYANLFLRKKEDDGNT